LEFPYRKQNRLQNYDYSQYGAYFITICTKNREPFLSTITVPQNKTAGPNVILTPFGQIVENHINMIPTKYPNTKIDAYVIMPDHVHMILVIVGDGSAVPQDKTNAVPQDKTNAIPQNKIAGPQDKTNTAPHNTKNGRANPAPTVGNIMGWFKYTTTKQMAHCWNTSDNRLWQRSYHDHIIRNEQDYRNICQYINENPIRWLQKHSHH